MEHTTTLTAQTETEPIATKALASVRRFAANYALALPIFLRRDMLYLWATFRLRYRPWKMLALIAILGVVCGLWQWAGVKYGSPRIQPLINPIQIVKVQMVLRQTAQAIFSSLNILSCIGIVIMARSLRHLLKQGHIEMLQLVPGRLRPSALYYAIATRYLPLAFVAILVIYISRDVSVNPFLRFPFIATGPQPPPGDMSAIFWAGMHQLSIWLFCPTNLFMDLAIAFWLFNRFRVSWPTTMIAVVAIGLISPIFLMHILTEVSEYVREHINMRIGIFARIADSIPPSPIRYETIRDIEHAAHYLLTSIISVVLGLLALGNLNDRWYRTEHSEKKDPVLLKPID